MLQLSGRYLPYGNSTNADKKTYLCGSKTSNGRTYSRPDGICRILCGSKKRCKEEQFVVYRSDSASVVYSLYGFRFAVNEAAYGYCKLLSCEHHDSLWRFRVRRFHRVVWRVSYCRALGALQRVTVSSMLLV